MLAWHIYHEILVEVLTEPIEERLRYIDTEKAKCEPSWKIELRKRLLKPVMGPLSEKIEKAYQEWAKADKEREKANQKRKKANQEWEKVLGEHQVEIEALHKVECPDCPWDGTTIFSEKVAP